MQQTQQFEAGGRLKNTAYCLWQYERGGAEEV